MRIVFCDNRLGGLLGFRRDIILHFVEQGYEVTLVAPKATTNWDKVGKVIPCVKIVHVPMAPNGLNPVSDIHTLFAYRALFKKLRPDVIFTYTIKPNIYAGMAAHSLGIPSVSMLAGLGYMFAGNNLLRRVIRRFYKWGIRSSRHVLVLNRSNYDQLLERNMVEPERLILLPGGEGVNLHDYTQQPADYSNGITFLMVSRVLYDKGYTEFVQAAKVVRNKAPRVRFEILGPLAYDSPMGVEDAVFEADRTAGHFRYLGVTNDVAEFVGRPNVVVVVPSKYGEGLNRSLMEACAIGRPIITTDIPGCRETVEEGKNGYLVPMGNTAHLIRAIKQFIALSEKEKRAMAEHSHQLAVERFDVQDVIDVYDRIINDLFSH